MVELRLQMKVISVAEVTGSNPVEALMFQASSFQLLKLENLLR